jgi:hypothetical protein
MSQAHSTTADRANCWPAKLGRLEDKRRQLGQMSEFLRAKLEDLGSTHQDE